MNNKTIFSLKALICVLLTAKAIQASNDDVLKNIFGATESHQNRKKLGNITDQNGSLLFELGDGGLKIFGQFLEEIDCPAVAQKTNTESKEALCKAAKQLKLQQLSTLFAPMPENLGGMANESFYLTHEEREKLVDEITIPAFKLMTNLDEKQTGRYAEWNRWDFTNKPKQYSVKIGHSSDLKRGNNPQGIGFEKKSQFDLPKLFAGSLVGAGIVWYLYKQYTADQDRTSAA